MAKLIESAMARLGETASVALAGAVIGLLFGFFAHRSRFCLRSAVIEFARGTHEGKLTVWLFTFSTAMLLTQAFILAGWLDVDTSRIGKLDGLTLVDALRALYETANKQVALVIDEAQHALTSEAGEAAMTALKSARDQLNRAPIGTSANTEAPTTLVSASSFGASCRD